MSITATPLSSTPITDGLPISSELTVAQAARLIDVPVGYIDELLDTGLVVFRWENDKRLIQRDSLLGFETEYQDGLETLAAITRESQEMGLYD